MEVVAIIFLVSGVIVLASVIAGPLLGHEEALVTLIPSLPVMALSGAILLIYGVLEALP